MPRGYWRDARARVSRRTPRRVELETDRRGGRWEKTRPARGVRRRRALARVAAWCRHVPHAAGSLARTEASHSRSFEREARVARGTDPSCMFRRRFSLACLSYGDLRFVKAVGSGMVGWLWRFGIAASSRQVVWHRPCLLYGPKISSSTELQHGTLYCYCKQRRLGSSKRKGKTSTLSDRAISISSRKSLSR